jgi:hypothetical protein
MEPSRQVLCLRPFASNFLISMSGKNRHSIEPSYGRPDGLEDLFILEQDSLDEQSRVPAAASFSELL